MKTKIFGAIFFIINSMFFVGLILCSHHAKAEESRPPMVAKYLKYQFNEAVMIVISNLECPFPPLKAKYPFLNVAFRIDGEKLVGCYRKKDEDNIEIQWKGGDNSTLPANAFLPTPKPNL